MQSADWGHLAHRSVEYEVETAELEGVPKVHARRTVGKDLVNQPNEQRERYPSVRHPVENVVPRSLEDKKHEKVGAQVHRREPALRHDKEGHHDGAVEHLRRVEHE